MFKLNAGSKLPTFPHPVKGGMALERPHLGRQQAEADRAAAVAVVDAVDERRQLVSPLVVMREQIRLMHGGGHQVIGSRSGAASPSRFGIRLGLLA